MSQIGNSKFLYGSFIIVCLCLSPCTFVLITVVQVQTERSALLEAHLRRLESRQREFNAEVRVGLQAEREEGQRLRAELGAVEAQLVQVETASQQRAMNMQAEMKSVGGLAIFMMRTYSL